MGKTLAKRSRKTVISLRIENDLLDALDIEVDNEKFSSLTEAVDHYIKKGQLLESLTAISKDPEKKKELHEKFMKVLHMDDMERTLETCDLDTLKLIRAITNEKIERKFNQLVLNVKAS